MTQKVAYAAGKSLGLTPQQVDAANNAFLAVDADHSGKIDLEELSQLLIRMFTPKMKEGLIRRLASMKFANADKDKSGTIDFEEFLVIYAEFLRQ